MADEKKDGDSTFFEQLDAIQPKQAEILDREERAQAALKLEKALNPDNLFDPPQQLGTDDLGKRFTERTAELLLDPAKAFAFVDWIDAPERDCANVNVKTAEWLRDTMRHSRAMVLLLSEHSAQSFWVQWELGYFDALRGYVFLVPLDPGAREAIKQQQCIESGFYKLCR